MITRKTQSKWYRVNQTAGEHLGQEGQWQGCWHGAHAGKVPTKKNLKGNTSWLPGLITPLSWALSTIDAEEISWNEQHVGAYSGQLVTKVNKDERVKDLTSRFKSDSNLELRWWYWQRWLKKSSLFSAKALLHYFLLFSKTLFWLLVHERIRWFWNTGMYLRQWHEQQVFCLGKKKTMGKIFWFDFWQTRRDNLVRI